MRVVFTTFMVRWIKQYNGINHLSLLIHSFSQVLNTLKNHIPQCDGEEKEWTTSCFNRTLEEFTFINSRRVEQENESAIATETIEVVTESDSSFCTIMKNYGDAMKTKV